MKKLTEAQEHLLSWVGIKTLKGKCYIIPGCTSFGGMTARKSTVKVLVGLGLIEDRGYGEYALTDKNEYLPCNCGDSQSKCFCVDHKVG